MMRHMNDIHIVTPQRHRQRILIPPDGTAFRLQERTEVWRKLAELLVAAFRSDQQVFVYRVDRSEIPHEVPDICADAELIDLPNIDCDAHGSVQPAIL